MADSKKSTFDYSQEMDPEKYFEYIKECRHEASSEYLQSIYDQCEHELRKAYATGQVAAQKKILFLLDTLPKEKMLLELGINTFVYRDDVEFFIDKVAAKAVKVIELEKYPRSIPDEVVQQVVTLREQKIFDKYYVVFTDYTGETERKVADDAKRKDPIIFGVFADRENLNDRFYYIADWEDEYCDLTLSRMLSECAASGRDIENTVILPDVTPEMVREHLYQLEEQKNGKHRLKLKAPENKKSVFQKVVTWLTRT